ncbi:MAG TPA: TadE/TadG family type IV pilus assembly protein [Mycobacteriales bacterium]|nr:TadE/TadG family type IV pilus assembly protein [Mycobacteriales bacterium]
MTATGFRGRLDQAGERDRGAFATLELAILLPFVIVMLLIVVAFGRVERGRELIDQAAASAARAASLATSPGAAQTAAIGAATQTLENGGMSCAGMQITVDTSSFHPGGDVTAHLTCTANLSGLTLSGVPGDVHLASSATSPLEPFRQLTTGTTS